jgi:hypothetical protein
MSSAPGKNRDGDTWVDCKKAQLAYEAAKAQGLVTGARKDELSLSSGQIARICGRDYKKGRQLKERARVFASNLKNFAQLCNVEVSSLEIPPDKVGLTGQGTASGLHDAAFSVVPSPGTGANWRPDPSSLDEQQGYQFMGQFEIEAGIDCDVRNISLHVMRNDHFAVCAAPGKQSYHDFGSLPGTDGKIGFVAIDGDKHYVDANYNFVKLLRYKAGQKLIVSIRRWCRAVGLSRDDPETGSLWYWLDDPTPIFHLEYSHGGLDYVEQHHFSYDSAMMRLKWKGLIKGAQPA